MRFSTLAAASLWFPSAYAGTSLFNIFSSTASGQVQGQDAVLSSTTTNVASSAIKDFILVNAQTGKDIKLMSDGMQVNTKTLGDQLTIRVEAVNAGFVKIDFDNGQIRRVEHNAPYYLAGNAKNAVPYAAHSLAVPGMHTITACPNDSGVFGRPDSNHQTADGSRRKLQNEPGCLSLSFVTVAGALSNSGSAELPSTDVPPAVSDIYGAMSGEFKQWHKITGAFSGPPASETGMTIPGAYRAPSTFADYRLDVTFQHPASGTAFVVPGYYAGDGDSANNQGIGGSVWQCHFTPPLTGFWTWAAKYAEGTNVAQNGGGNPAGFFDGAAGSFDIVASDKTGRDFRSKGRLRAVGKGYYQFANGEYFMKAGPDSPQNLLAYDDFDGASNYGSYSKSYAPHEADYVFGDPTFANGKGTGLIGAINYLAGKGMNVISVTTLDVDGDDKNVYPFLNTDNQLYYDISKLAQWGVIFDYAGQMGISLRIKLQDAASDDALNQGNLYEERKLYYREMIARFGHHLAVVWDLGEDLSADRVAERSAYIRATDPYSSPITVRTSSPTATPTLLAIDTIDGISLHTEVMGNIYANTAAWLATSTSTIAVSSDEQGTLSAGVLPDANDPTHDSVRQDVLWGNLMAGGAGVQYYFGTAYNNSDLTLQDFRSRDVLWDQSRHALEFFSANQVPFQAMSPNSAVVAGSSAGGSLLCLAAADASAIVVYKKAGSGVPKVNLSSKYSVRWYNPRKGGALAVGSIATVAAGSGRRLGRPPDWGDADWVILLRKV